MDLLLQVLVKHAKEMPDKVALIDGDISVTYENLWINIRKAATFYSRTSHKGDRIILSASKSVDFVYSYFGSHLAGLIVIPIDPAVNATRLNRILHVAEPCGIYGSLFLNGGDLSVMPFPDISDEIPSDNSLPEWNDVADILFTTGTTGQPKGVVLSHHNEFSTACNINSFIGNTKEDVELLALPISHSFGLGRMRCTLLAGATLVILGSFANMKLFFRKIEQHGVTGFGMVPASWNYMRKMSGNRIMEYKDQIKYIEIGSAPMSLNDKQLLMKLLPWTHICMHYGLTEASRSTFISFHDDAGHLDSIGKPSPNVDVKIFGDDGLECASGQAGELCVKGDNVCSDYWADHHSEYLSSFYDGYFRTGDWGYKDEDGYFYLISRKKELINVGGKKVSPMEIEEVINGIKGIDESACVGIPDKVMGEVVKAFVVKSDSNLTDDYIINYCRSRLEEYKVPVSVAFVSQLPKSSSGKLKRLLLK